MLVADLEGPGVIRALHSTRHGPKEIADRGVVLEIYFDDASEPAVRCPIADFFGDGCNGGSMIFSTNFIKRAPGSYNTDSKSNLRFTAYFPFGKTGSISIRIALF
jgi:hypothetical protein